MNTKTMFSSAKSDWTTPQQLFDRLDATFHFDLDAAASDENAKCEKYFTVEDDGLKQDWGGHRVFLNPPYGRDIERWVEKGFIEALKPCTTVVMLLPARTDTKWFHDYCISARVVFLRGRIKFGNAKYNAPFPSMIVIFAQGWKCGMITGGEEWT